MSQLYIHLLWLQQQLRNLLSVLHAACCISCSGGQRLPWCCSDCSDCCSRSTQVPLCNLGRRTSSTQSCSWFAAGPGYTIYIACSLSRHLVNPRHLDPGVVHKSFAIQISPLAYPQCLPLSLPHCRMLPMRRTDSTTTWSPAKCMVPWAI